MKRSRTITRLLPGLALCLVMAFADPRFFRLQNIMIILQDASTAGEFKPFGTVVPLPAAYASLRDACIQGAADLSLSLRTAQAMPFPPPASEAASAKS